LKSGSDDMKVLKELQKNFTKQKFGEKFLEQEAAPAPAPSRPEPPAKAPSAKGRKEPVVVAPSCPEQVPNYQFSLARHCAIHNCCIYLLR